MLDNQYTHVYSTIKQQQGRNAMDFGFITSNDMRDFETKHKQAYNFLLHRSLLNEKRHLETNEYILNEWQKKRLAELNYLEVV